MARGQEIKIGPWAQGINLLDKPDQLEDGQLVSCINFDIDNTGVLQPRRPLKYQVQDATTLVKYLLSTVVLAGEVSPKALTATYDGATSSFKVIGIPGTVPVGLTNTSAGKYLSAVQYQNKIWYIPGESSATGKSSPAAVANTFTSVPLMPYGDYGFILKDRLFIVRKASSEIYFSKATDFAIWAAPDGGVIQVNPGDNQPITKVVTVNNQIIIFKRDSTFTLTFNNNPTGDGTLRQVSADQGALDAITYNNEIYCYNARSVFKFINGFFQDIGIQLNLTDDLIDSSAVSPARINIVGKNLIFGTTPAGFTYALNLDSGAWTMYTLPVDLSLSTGTIYSRSDAGTGIFFGDGTTKLSYLLVNRNPVSRPDIGSDGVPKSPAFTIKTKEYDFDDSETWKRLYSWHLDSQFISAPLGSTLTYSGSTVTNTSADVTDLIGSNTSFRFKRVAMSYTSSPYTTSNADSPVGLIIRSVRAVVGVKAPVSV